MKYETKVIDSKTWVYDERDNRASVYRWGSEEKAIESLDTLDDCFRCSDCFDCSDCFRCFDCSDCFRCSDCFDCSDCFRCSDCSDCFRCSDCSGCSRCFDCSDCSGCSRCFDCSGKNQLNEVFEIPVIEDIHKKIYEAVSAEDALDMSDWHTCDITHCRAGWVTTLAGKAGKDLEEKTTCLFAAQQIYKASGYEISPVRFFDSNEDAMADMKRLAKKS